MSRPRIALLNASFDDEHTRRNFRRELAADLVEFDCTDGATPPNFAYDGLVVTGSRASVYWDEPWIADVQGYVREALDSGVPTLGVCWGHQLLADVLGGRVAPMGEYELGYRSIRHHGRPEGNGDRPATADPTATPTRAGNGDGDSTGDSDGDGDSDGGNGRDDLAGGVGLFDGIAPEFTAFTTHSDEVVAVPPGAEVLAQNDYSIQAFRAGSAWGVQFHPEYDRATARDVTRSKDLPDERIARVLSGIDEETYRAACEAKQVFDNFLRYVQHSSSETTG